MRHFVSKPISISVLPWAPGARIPNVLEGPDKSCFIHTPQGKHILRGGDFVVVETNTPSIQRVFSAIELANRFDEVVAEPVSQVVAEPVKPVSEKPSVAKSVKAAKPVKAEKPVKVKKPKKAK